LRPVRRDDPRAMVSAPSRRRWPARVAGLLGTSALLGSGVAIALMVMPSPKEEAVVPTAPAATPAPDAEPPKPRKPKLTRAQRRARGAAVAVLTQQGFEPVRLGDYNPRNKLRVLIGRPATDDAGPRRAFFFVDGRFIGHDSDAPSARLQVARARDRAITLSYGLYEPGDRRCCPKGGTARVRFRWDGATLAPQDEIPLAHLRVPLA
jgi:LppP/LprE lipoprotein